MNTLEGVATVVAGPDGRRDVRWNAGTACTPEQIAACNAAPLEEAERVRSFYEGRSGRVKSAKRPKRVPPRSATSSAGGRRGGDDDLASENVRSW